MTVSKDGLREIRLVLIASVFVVCAVTISIDLIKNLDVETKLAYAWLTVIVTGLICSIDIFHILLYDDLKRH